MAASLNSETKQNVSGV